MCLPISELEIWKSSRLSEISACDAEDLYFCEIAVTFLYGKVESYEGYIKYISMKRKRSTSVTEITFTQQPQEKK